MLFASWNTDPDGDGDSYNPDVEITNNIQEDIDLYAQWRDIVYQITYNVNGDTSVIPSATVNYGESIDELPTASLSPLTFLGWSTTGATGPVNVTAPYTPTGTTENITLYAVFGSTGTDDFEITAVNSGIGNSYAGNSSFEIDEIDFTCYDICKQGSSTQYYIQMKSSGYIYNDDNNSFGKITSVVITYNNTTTSGTVKFGTAYNPASSTTADGVVDQNDNKIYTYTPASDKDYGYIRIGASETIQINSIIINYETSAPVTIINVTDAQNMASIGENTSILVKNGGVLTYSGTNTDETKLIIEDGGQLVCGTSVAVTMKKSIVASKADNPETEEDETENKWYAISSPINNMAFSEVTNLVNISNDPKHNVYRYDEKSAKWQEYRDDQNDFDKFDLGRGYLFRTLDDNGMIEYKGNVNVDEVECTLSCAYNGSNTGLMGFNLIGNPFTHNITWAYMSDKNNVADGYYLLSTAGAWIPEESTKTEPISPMVAFLVQATDEDASFTINNDIQTGKGETYANDNIMFTVKNSEYSDVAYVLFKEGHGLNKIEHRNAEIPMLYVINNSENFAIADMPDNTSVINIGFEAKTMGQYTFSLKTEGHYSYMHLYDKLTGEDVNMLLEDSYTFIGSPSDRKDRFVLNLSYNGGPSTGSGTEVFAYQSGNDIIVSGEGELQVFDVMGRMVATQTVNGVKTVSGLNNGVYIFRMGGKTQKIVIR